VSARPLFVDQSGGLGGAEISLLDVVAGYRDRAAVVVFDEGPFVDRLRERGVDTQVLRLGGSVSGVRKESSGVGQMLSGPGVLRAAWRLSRMAREFDVLYANTQKAFVVSAMAGVMARRPVIWHLRDMLTAEHFSGMNRRVAVTLANRIARRIIVNSHATKESFVAAGGRADRVTVVHNGIDPAPFDAVDGAEAAKAREGLGVGAGFVIGVFGRLAPWKGQHVVIEALAGLEGVGAVIVGDALFGETAYAEWLRRMVEEQGLGDRVKLVGFRDDVPVLMKAVDAVVHSSTSPEPFGRVIVEGMLAGRPVIATNAGGAAEIVTDGETGLLTPPGDAVALREAIGRLASDRAWSRSLAERGGRHAREHFSLEAMLEPIDAVLREVCGHGRGERDAAATAESEGG